MDWTTSEGPQAADWVHKRRQGGLNSDNLSGISSSNGNLKLGKGPPIASKTQNRPERDTSTKPVDELQTSKTLQEAEGCPWILRWMVGPVLFSEFLPCSS